MNTTTKNVIVQLCDSTLMCTLEIFCGIVNNMLLHIYFGKIQVQFRKDILGIHFDDCNVLLKVYFFGKRWAVVDVMCL